MRDFYCFKALNHDNKVIKDYILINNKDALYEHLKSKNLKLIKAFLPYRSKIKPSKKRINDRLLEWFYFLAEFLKANIPLLEAFKMLSLKEQNLYLKKTLYEIIDHLENGKMLSDSFKKCDPIFSSTIIQTIMIAEARNDFLNSFINLNGYLKWVMNIKQKIKEALIYPLFLFVFIGVIAMTLNFYFVPELESFLKHTQADLSGLNGWFWIRENIMFLITGVLFVIASFFMLVFKYPFKEKTILSNIVFKIPIIYFFITLNMIRFLKTLSLMMDSNIDFKNSLDFASKEFSLKTFQDGYLKLREDILNGCHLSSAIERLIFVDPLIIRFIELGEKTGNFSKNLLFVVGYLQNNLENQLNKIISYLQPSFIFITGLLLLWMVYAFLGPIYNNIPGLTL